MSGWATHRLCLASSFLGDYSKTDDATRLLSASQSCCSVLRRTKSILFWRHFNDGMLPNTNIHDCPKRRLQDIRIHCGCSVDAV